MRANSRLAPAQVHGRGSAARPPKHVGGCGFGPSVIPSSIPRRAALALIAPWRISQPLTEHSRALRGAILVVVRENARRDSPQLHGRGSAARPPHQVGGCGFGQSIIPRSTPVAGGPRAHRPVDNRTTAHRASARSLSGEDLVVVRAKTRRAPFQLVGRGTAARPPHQVGGCGFELSVIPRSIPVARGPRAYRPVENRPSAHELSARALRGADLIVVRANSRRALRRRSTRARTAR